MAITRLIIRSQHRDAAVFRPHVHRTRLQQLLVLTEYLSSTGDSRDELDAAIGQAAWSARVGRDKYEGRRPFRGDRGSPMRGGTLSN